MGGDDDGGGGGDHDHDHDHHVRYVVSLKDQMFTVVHKNYLYT